MTNDNENPKKENEFNEDNVGNFFDFFNHDHKTEIRVFDVVKYPYGKSVTVSDKQEFISTVKKFNVDEEVDDYIGGRDRTAKGDDNVVSSKFIFLEGDEHDIKKPELKEKIENFLKEHNIEIGMCGFSGGGFHFYIPHKHIDFLDEKDREAYEIILKAFRKALLNNGIDIDPQVFNLERVSRVLGTYNYKRKALSKILYINKDIDLEKNTQAINDLIANYKEAESENVDTGTAIEILEKNKITITHPWLPEMIINNVLIRPNTGRNDIVVKYAAMICVMERLSHAETITVAKAVFNSCKDSNLTTFFGWIKQMKENNKLYDGYKNQINKFIKDNNYPLTLYQLDDEEKEANREHYRKIELEKIQNKIDKINIEDINQKQKDTDSILEDMLNLNELLVEDVYKLIKEKTNYPIPKLREMFSKKKNGKNNKKPVPSVGLVADNEIKGENQNQEQEPNSKNLLEVLLPGRGILVSEFAKLVSEIIKNKNTLFYRTDSQDIIEIGKLKLHKTGEEIFTGMIPMKPSRFITVIEKFLMPGRMFQNSETDEWEFKAVSMNSDTANTLLTSEILRQALPQITRIFTIPLPIMDEGKLTFPKKGYDIRFSSWLPYDAPEITNPEMSLDEAKKIIETIFKEFCFQTDQDRTNAIAALLTPFLRGLYSHFNARTPVIFYLANRERCGKDYLAGITGIVYEGAALEETPLSNEDNKGNSDDELRKKILSAFIGGRKRLHFANNKGYLNNAVFEAVITNEKFSDRLLGKNETPIFDNELEFSLSGNVGIDYTADFANRSIFTKLFLEIENANDRTFENPNLHEWVKEHRSEILSALYALVRNWVDKKMMPGKLSFASYPEWARVCGGIMEAASYDSPCVKDTSGLLDGDFKTNQMKELFKLCYEKYPEKWIAKEEILLIAKNPENEIFSYIDLKERSGQTIFGKELARFTKRILLDIRMIVDDEKKKGSRQKFMFTSKLTKIEKQETISKSEVKNDENDKK